MDFVLLHKVHQMFNSAILNSITPFFEILKSVSLERCNFVQAGLFSGGKMWNR